MSFKQPEILFVVLGENSGSIPELIVNCTPVATGNLPLIFPQHHSPALLLQSSFPYTFKKYRLIFSVVLGLQKN
jgi:hypothetical protein